MTDEPQTVPQRRIIFITGMSGAGKSTALNMFEDLGFEAGLFEWHTDHYDLPNGAVNLATGSDYAHQCFRMGRATYAMQFHFEITRDIVDGWISMTGDFCNREVPGYQEWLPGQFDTHMKPSMDFCRTAIQNWLALR